MKPKSHVLICLALIFCVTATSQQHLLRKADTLFNKFAFVDAAKAYEDLISKDYNANYAAKKLADSYTYLRHPENALIHYKKVVQGDNVPVEYYYKYAQALRSTGDYDASRIWLKKFNDNGGSIEVNNLSKDADFITSIFNAKQHYFLKEVNFNSDLSDFGAYERDGKIYFTSSADRGVSLKHRYGWNKQPFLDVYVVEKGSNSVIHHKSKLKGKINSKYHDGPIAITNDGNTLYFSRNNFKKYALGEGKKGVNNLKIYKASLVEGKWTNIEDVSFNSDEYSVGHPALNSDNTKLYFASDMPGSIGKSDIYYVDINNDGSFGKPQNLGSKINTKKNELFPFVNNEDVLFFSSEGHLGLGLLDIFASVADADKNITGVINLGKPINSSKDDFSFFMNNDGITGYIASNRKGHPSDDNIYAFRRLPKLKIEGTIKDTNSTPIAKTTVTLFDTEGTPIAYVEADENGHYSIDVERGLDYNLKTNKKGFLDNDTKITTKDLDNTVKSITRNFTLTSDVTPIASTKSIPLPPANFTPIYFDFDDPTIRPDEMYKLDKVADLMINHYPEMTIRIESHTDSRGTQAYNDNLSLQRAINSYNYLVSKGVTPSRITERIGMGKRKLANDCNIKNCTEVQHQFNRRTNFIITK